MTGDEMLNTIAAMSKHMEGVEERIAALSLRISDLEVRMSKGSPGRKSRPVLQREPGVCGLDPSCDSSKCEAANVYRYQQGCLGTACVEKNREYYAEYRERRRQRSA